MARKAGACTGFCIGMLAMNLAGMQNANAGPSDYVYVPTVEAGEREFELKYGSASPGNLQGLSVGYGYGIGQYWFTEVSLKQERSNGSAINLAEWESKFQLTDTGRYPVDLGLITELEAPLSEGEPWEFRLGPLLQTEFGKLQLNGNVLFEHAYGKADETGAPYTTNLAYQWQGKYRWLQELEFGVQGFGDMGKWNDWSDPALRGHLMGPAIFGKIWLERRSVSGKPHAIKYNAAWLRGTGTAIPGHVLRLQLEYEY